MKKDYTEHKQQKQYKRGINFERVDKLFKGIDGVTLDSIEIRKDCVNFWFTVNGVYDFIGTASRCNELFSSENNKRINKILEENGYL